MDLLLVSGPRRLEGSWLPVNPRLEKLPLSSASTPSFSVGFYTDSTVDPKKKEASDVNPKKEFIHKIDSPWSTKGPNFTNNQSPELFAPGVLCIPGRTSEGTPGSPHPVPLIESAMGVPWCPLSPNRPSPPLQSELP